MAFNGSGVFNRIYNWVTDRNNGLKIQATRMDTEMDGFADGLSNCITKDGQTTITDNIPFNNKRITSLGAATAGSDAMNRDTADARYVRVATGTGAPFAQGATGGTETDISTGAYVARLTMNFTPRLPRVMVFASLCYDNSGGGADNIVDSQIEIRDNASTLLNFDNATAYTPQKNQVGHCFLMQTLSGLTIGSTYSARIAVRKQVATGPIYPRFMRIYILNF